MVIGGTKWPSMTSTWMTVAPAATTSSTCSRRRPKSAARIEGAMRVGSYLERSIAPPQWLHASRGGGHAHDRRVLAAVRADRPQLEAVQAVDAAVAAGQVRGPQPRLAAVGAASARGRRPQPSRGDNIEPAVSSRWGRCARRRPCELLLGRGERADAVDQPPARRQRSAGGGEQRVLLGQQPLDAVGRHPPAQVGVGAQRAQAAARRVEQDAVERCPSASRGVGADDARRCVAPSRSQRPAQRARRGRRGARTATTSPSSPISAARCGRLAARRGAEVEDPLARLRVDDLGDELASARRTRVAASRGRRRRQRASPARARPGGCRRPAARGSRSGARASPTTVARATRGCEWRIAAPAGVSSARQLEPSRGDLAQHGVDDPGGRWPAWQLDGLAHRGVVGDAVEEQQLVEPELQRGARESGGSRSRASMT